MRQRLITAVALAVLLLAGTSGVARSQADSDKGPGGLTIPSETAQQALERHAKVAERRRGIGVICHRGASEFAHENTLEAYRATFELGGDGNEIDIRATKDGVLVCFHDDMLDQRLEGYGDVSEVTWDELRQMAFREPGPFGEQCRIPTLVEVFDLHRRHAGLLHLDIKRPGLDKAIAELLDRMDMWDHVAYCNGEHGGVILTDARLKLRRYKAGLYQDRSEVFPEAIAAALEKPGDDVIVDDPRGVIVALGRKLGRPSRAPVAAVSPAPRPLTRELPPERELRGRAARSRRLGPRGGHKGRTGGFRPAHPRPGTRGRAAVGSPGDVG